MMSVFRAMIIGGVLVLLSLLGTSAFANPVPVWGTFETAHPYAANADQSWVLETSARRVRLHFSGFNTEDLHDRVIITDTSGTPLLEPITGVRGDFWTPWLNAGDVQVRLVTDGDQEGWGFRVSQIEAELVDGLVNVNTATSRELQTLKGIGSVTAANIIAWRDANGGFVTKRDLLKVSGIGPTTLRGFQAAITTRFDLNVADRATLLRLPGITEVLADAVIARRTLKPFKSVDELTTIAGVTPQLMAIWRHRIAIIVEIAKPGLVNVNVAPVLELQSLKGIGPTLSSRIAVSRVTDGWFLTPADLLRIKGISAGVLDGFRSAMYATSPGVVRIQSDAPVALAPLTAPGHLYGEGALSVAAFNVQVLGLTKMAKPEVVRAVTDTIRRYDLILIQELRDGTGEALRALHSAVNAWSGPQYDVLASDRLGRTTSREQYVWFYRRDRVGVLDSFHFDDGLEPYEDTFEREPHVALFSARGLTFAAVAIHTAPEDAVAEVDALTDVVASARARWGAVESMVLGDFNADCTYVGSNDWSAISLRTLPDFTWLIGDVADTTASSTDCAYDRLVVTPGLAAQVVPGTAQPVRIDQLFRMDPSLTLQVSDHYPVEVGVRLP